MYSLDDLKSDLDISLCKTKLLLFDTCGCRRVWFSDDMHCGGMTMSLDYETDFVSEYQFESVTATTARSSQSPSCCGECCGPRYHLVLS